MASAGKTFYGLTEEELWPEHGKIMKEENLRIFATGEMIEKDREVVVRDGGGDLGHYAPEPDHHRAEEALSRRLGQRHLHAQEGAGRLMAAQAGPSRFMPTSCRCCR